MLNKKDADLNARIEKAALQMYQQELETHTAIINELFADFNESQRALMIKRVNAKLKRIWHVETFNRKEQQK